MEFGFSVFAGQNEVEFRLARRSPGGGSAQLESYSSSGSSAAVLLGRLYYRDFLAKAISAGASGRTADDTQSNDAALALSAYFAFGASGLGRLEGDFSVVIWDGQKQSFFSRRDPYGAYPLYWTRVGGATAFATGLRALLELLPSRALNLDYLANFLSGTKMGGADGAESCVYQGIRRVDTAHILTVNAADGRESREPCWNWLNRARDPGTDKLDEVAHEYGSLLRNAVRERIHGVTASHLSGGIDSTSTCLLALEFVNDGAGDPPLHALSLTYEKLPILAKETPFIETVLENAGGGLSSHRVSGDDVLHFDILNNPPVHDEPIPDLWSLGPECALTSKAAELGVDAFLSGEGADDLLHSSPAYIADLLSQGRLLAAWGASCAWARSRGSNPWSILRQHGVANTPFGRRIGGWFGKGRHIAVNDMWSVPDWISEDFVRRHRLKARAPDDRSRMYRQGKSTVSSMALYGIQGRTNEPERSILAAPRGVSLAHPFLDPRVTALGLGIQERFRAPSALRKPVLAEAMRGVVPEKIRTRRNTLPFNEVLYLGYRRNLHKLQAMVRQAPIDDFRMIDKEVLVGCIEEAAVGVAMPNKLRRLNETLSLITWLSMRSQWESRPIAPTENIRIPYQAGCDAAARIGQKGLADAAS